MTKEQEQAIRGAAENTFRDREMKGYYIHTNVSAAITEAIKTYHKLMVEEAKKTAEAFGDLDNESEDIILKVESKNGGVEVTMTKNQEDTAVALAIAVNTYCGKYNADLTQTLIMIKHMIVKVGRN